MNGNAQGPSVADTFSATEELLKTESALRSLYEQDVRKWRLEIDKLIWSVESEFFSSREVSLCKTQLQRAKPWLGWALKAIGTQNPYPNSSNPENKIIEPQAEHDDAWSFKYQKFETQVERVKAMRGDVQGLIDSMGLRFYGLGYLEIGKSKDCLIEAKHWLGWELDRIRKEQNESGVPPTSPPKSLF